MAFFQKNAEPYAQDRYRPIVVCAGERVWHARGLVQLEDARDYTSDRGRASEVSMVLVT